MNSFVPGINLGIGSISCLHGNIGRGFCSLARNFTFLVVPNSMVVVVVVLGGSFKIDSSPAALMVVATGTVGGKVVTMLLLSVEVVVVVTADSDGIGWIGVNCGGVPFCNDE